MGRAPCCEKVGLKKGRWTGEEDEILLKYIQANGEGSWRSLPKNAGLLRCGKSCRLRWINYLRADLKRGNISPEEEDLIIKLHNSLGNKWSLIAGHLPGRTDNEIKNYWNSHLSRRIHSFIRRPNYINTTTGNYEANHPPPVVVMADLAKLSSSNSKNGSKSKGGKKSRSAAMKKKNNNISNNTPSTVQLLKIPTDEQKTTEKSGCEGDVMTQIILGQVEERESTVLDSYEEGSAGEERETSPYGGEILGHHSEEMIESGLLGSPYVDLEAGIDIMGNEMLGPHGVLSSFSEERENGVMGGFTHDHHHDQEGLVLMDSNNYKGTSATISDDHEERSTHVGVNLSSNNIGDHHQGSHDWYYSSASLMTTSSSSFEDEWAHWDFELGNVAEDHMKVWNERELEMLSWLWESDDYNNINGGADQTAN